MTEIDIAKLLNRLEDMESRLAAMYEALRERFLADANAAGFFYRMNIDEIGHRDVIRFQRRLIRNSRLNFDNVKVDVGQIDTLLCLVESATAPGITLKDALALCLDIDRNPAAVYYISVICQVNADISAMMGNLGLRFVEHYAELEKFVSMRGVQLSESAPASLLSLGIEPRKEPEPAPEPAPEAAEPAGADAAPEEPRPAAPVRKGHILVVEDNLNARRFLFEILSGAGHHVDIATDGIEATEVLLNSQFPFDLVISDINMPNMDGFKLMELTAQRKIDVPFVVLTSRTADEDVVRARGLGAADFLRKPIKPEVILFSVNSLLYGQSTAAV